MAFLSDFKKIRVVLKTSASQRITVKYCAHRNRITSASLRITVKKQYIRRSRKVPGGYSACPATAAGRGRGAPHGAPLRKNNRCDAPESCPGPLCVPPSSPPPPMDHQEDAWTPDAEMAPLSIAAPRPPPPPPTQGRVKYASRPSLQGWAVNGAQHPLTEPAHGGVERQTGLSNPRQKTSRRQAPPSPVCRGEE